MRGVTPAHLFPPSPLPSLVLYQQGGQLAVGAPVNSCPPLSGALKARTSPTAISIFTPFRCHHTRAWDNGRGVESDKKCCSLVQRAHVVEQLRRATEGEAASVEGEAAPKPRFRLYFPRRPYTHRYRKTGAALYISGSIFAQNTINSVTPRNIHIRSRTPPYRLGLGMPV